MPKNISLRKLIYKFRQLGFDGPYYSGRHLFMVKGSLNVHISNPHKGDISKHLVAEILHQAGINVKDWNNLDG